MAHQPDDGFLEVLEGPEVRVDVLVEATFVNPYSSTVNYWEHGFLLKDGPRNRHYWVSIDRDGEWEYFHRVGESEALGRHTEESNDINREPGDSNQLQVVITGDRGWVYINGEFQGGMDLSVDTGGHGVSTFTDDEYVGETRFEDFTIWRWSPTVASKFSDVDPNATPTPTPTPDPKTPIFGPVSGRIQHEEEDGRFEIFDGPDIDGNVMVEVIFEVPFEPNESHWNFGLWFDSEKRGAFHIVDISGIFGGAYNHWRKSGPEAEWQGRRSEDVIGIKLQKGEKNHIRVILIDQSAWLYVNDRRMGILNFALGDIPAPDWVGLVVNDRDFQGSRYSLGGHTKFTDFTVWRWHPSLFELPDDG